MRGGIRLAQASDPEVTRNFPYPAVLDVVAKNADANGYFFYSGNAASSTLQGTYFKVNCTGCTPNPPLVTTSGNGILDFGVGGVNQTSNGRSTPADRTSFFHLNVARAMGAKWITRPWLLSNVGVNVNIAQTCNAFWNNVTVNFFRSGGGCANTGEIRDVMQHEWGHGLDANDGIPAAEGGTGEAYGDHIALFVDHDSCIGQSFFGNSSGPYCIDIPACGSTATCTGVRNTDEARATRGLLTMSNANGPGKCPVSGGCKGPLGLECHCEGEIWGQAEFHLANNLLTGKGYDTGTALPGANPAFGGPAAWFILEHLFYTS